jgi:hypothetical protein
MIRKMRKFVFLFFALSAFSFIPLQAQAGVRVDFPVQVGDIFQKVLLLQQQLREFAFTQPVRASLTFPEQKQVALQVGHWKLEDVIWELRNLDPHRQAQGGGWMEWQVNLAIAKEAQKLLEAEGVGVTLLPAILPGVYKADAFVAIHADQNPSMPWASGFKVASSAFDESKKASRLAQLMREEYRQATWLDQETYIPLSMPYYYAFNSEKFLHVVHPDTPAIIIETGYLPNPRDRAIITTNPQMAAAGIANAVLKFLEEEI